MGSERKLDDPRHRIASIDPFGIAIEATEPGLHVRDIEVEALRDLARRHNILLLRGFDNFAEAEELSAYCERWGELGVWPYGTVFELVEQENPEDHTLDHNYMPMHWDGMYREVVPEFQIFQCVSAPGVENGGETTFTNTTKVLRDVDADTADLWSRITGTYHHDSPYYKSVVVSPLVTTHPTHGAPIIRYNEPPAAEDAEFINRPGVELAGVPDDEVARAHKSLRAAMYDPENLYAHVWQTGDLVVTDNYTLLHGRNAFTSKAPRHLRRVHVNGEPALVNTGLVR